MPTDAAVKAASAPLLKGPNLELPWASSRTEDQNFSRLLRRFLLIFSILALAIAYIPLPEQEREALEALPPRLAKAILENKSLLNAKSQAILKQRRKEQAESTAIESPKASSKE